MANIIIKKVPQKKVEQVSVKKTLQPVPRADASIEAQRNEVALGDFDYSGLPSLFTIGGQPHSNGGTPLNPPDNSFIYSNDKSMKIKDEDILKDFKRNPKPSGEVPANLAKQYDINYYRKILADPQTDKMQKETATLMIKNYNEKLGKLALIQESHKGMEDGIPYVALPYLESMGIDPASLVHGSAGAPEMAAPSTEDYQSMKYGGGLPKAIEGVTVKTKPKKDYVYSQDARENLILAKKMGYDLQMPENLKNSDGWVDKVQKRLPNNVYGRTDWTQPKYYEDFKKRAAWYLKDNPNFDPTKEKDVADFQDTYNNRLVSMGLNPELRKDGYFGEHTYSIYDLNNLPKTAAAPAAETPATKQDPLPARHLAEVKRQAAPAPDFWTEDKVKMLGAFGDFKRIKKYMPWQAQSELYLPSATYYDPTRELAANSEQANQAGNMLSSYSNVQGASARFGEVQGKALENAANILGKYSSMNVEIANNSATNNANALTQFSQNRAAQATGLYDKSVIANQEFAHAKALARSNMRDTFVNAWTNRGKTQALNSMNKQYNVDSTTGFVNYTGVPGNTSADAAPDFISTYQSVLQQLGIGKDDKEGRKEALKIASQMHGLKSD